MDEEKLGMFFLAKMTHMPLEKKEKLFSRAGSAAELLDMPHEVFLRDGVYLTNLEIADYEKHRDGKLLRASYEEMEKKEIRFIMRGEPAYPERFYAIDAPPLSVFLRGDLPKENAPSAAIVGSRRCTPYGREMARFFAEKLSERGVAVISGMALGIDGHAGRGALCGRGGSFAVLGCGVDVCYPKENIDLYSALIREGGVISERPPGYHALPRDFPLRNRLISALGDVLLVIEAAPNSGSLISADHANAEGKEVFALPGRVGERMSEGTNRLIKNGAQVLLSPEDVLQCLGLSVGRDSIKRPGVKLNAAEEAVVRSLSFDATDLETIAEKTQIPLSFLTEVLVSLEIKGLIKRESAGGYTLVR